MASRGIRVINIGYILFTRFIRVFIIARKPYSNRARSARLLWVFEGFLNTRMNRSKQYLRYLLYKKCIDIVTQRLAWLIWQRRVLTMDTFAFSYINDWFSCFSLLLKKKKKSPA